MIRAWAFLIAALTLAAPAAGRAEVQTAWDHVDRVVVIGDLHGDYAKFHDDLVQAGLIDAKDHWRGGAAHLVQMGDVPDRRPDTRRILDLLMRLEPEARRSGGYVHALIGNHEAMNMEGDLRYTTDGEFAAFADRDSPRRRDAYFDATVAALKAHPPAAGLPTFDPAFRAAFDKDHPLGWVEHQIAWSPQGTYGRWILTHDAAVRIDDTLYVHGGLGPGFETFSLEVLDGAVVAALRHEPEAAGGPHDILWAENGPLWYRGLAVNDDVAEAPQVNAILAGHGVRRIVLGHTNRYSMINTRFGGAVILTDVAVKGGCPDPHAFLIKDGDVLTAVYRGQRLPLAPTGPAHDAYLATVAALDQAAGANPKCAAN